MPGTPPLPILPSPPSHRPRSRRQRAIPPSPEHAGLWNDFLARLKSDRDFTREQTGTLALLWARALDLHPSVSFPNVAVTREGGMEVSWRPAGRTLEFLVDREGRVAWFFHDVAARVSDGSEDFHRVIPERVFSYLPLFSRQPRTA